MHIEGTKLIRHNASGVDLPDDPSYPFRLDVNLRPPEFMGVAFIMLHGGSEEIVVRSKTADQLEAFCSMNDLWSHPRLRRLAITGPEGIVRSYPEAAA